MESKIYRLTFFITLYLVVVFCGVLIVIKVICPKNVKLCYCFDTNTVVIHLMAEQFPVNSAKHVCTHSVVYLVKHLLYF